MSTQNYEDINYLISFQRNADSQEDASGKADVGEALSNGVDDVIVVDVTKSNGGN